MKESGINIPEFELISIEDIKNSKVNREINSAHVNRLVALIKKNGFVDAVKVAKRNGSYISIEGQHRVEALLQLGVKKVPCLVIDWLDTNSNVKVQELVVDLNANNKSWNLLDYIKSHAEAGSEDYKYLLGRVSKANKELGIPTGAIASMYTGILRGNQVLKRGLYSPSDLVFSDTIFSKIMDLVSVCGKSNIPNKFMNNLAVKVQRNRYSRVKYELLSSLCNQAQNNIQTSNPLPADDEGFIKWFEIAEQIFNKQQQ